MPLRSNIQRLTSLVVAVAFGLFISLIPIGNRSWVPAALDKLREIVGIGNDFSTSNFKGFDSQRYFFKNIYQSNESGVFQLAQVGGRTIYAVERFTGAVGKLDLTNFRYSRVNNVFSDLSLTKITSPDKLPLVMDLASDNEYLYISIVVQNQLNLQENLRVFKYKLGKQKSHWIKVFESEYIADRANSQMWGGRIVLDPDNIYVSVGEQRFDRSGFPKNEQQYSNQEIDRTYFGKIARITKLDGKVSTFSSGHRNAQGLFIDSEGNFWESEHGPNGGDEVNILIESQNYGWPHVTLGKPYPQRYPSGKNEINQARNPRIGVDTSLDRFGFKSGVHVSYKQPIMSWAPGVGAGNLVRVDSTSNLVDWRGNLLIAMMGEETFHRLVIDKKFTVYHDERINIGARVRDFILTKSGILVISTDDGRLVVFKTFDSKLPQRL